jgi:hypothetical protein
MARRLILAAFGSILLAPQMASAHPTTSFDSCAAYRHHGGPCGDSASYVAGDRVFLRGRVRPPHASLTAYVVFLRPGADDWRRGVSVRISETGRMHWSFRSATQDADPTEPWLFRFRIPGHGKSDAAQVFLLSHK